jgi:hypothetical protein
VANAVVWILPNPARAKSFAVADFQYIAFELITHVEFLSRKV